MRVVIVDHIAVLEEYGLTERGFFSCWVMLVKLISIVWKITGNSYNGINGWWLADGQPQNKGGYD